jgi:excisionase family DNA binding protein
MSEPDLMTTQEVADWLRITRFSVYHYVKQGMPHYRIGPKHRFKRVEVEAWMKAQAEAYTPMALEHVPAAMLPDPKPVRPRAEGRQHHVSVAEAERWLKENMG